MKRLIFTVIAGLFLMNVNAQDENSTYNKAMEYFQQQEYNFAVREFTKCIGFDNSKPDYFYKQGLSHLALKNYNKAYESFVDADGLSPNNVNYTYYIGVALLKQNKGGDATGYLDNAKRLVQKDTTASFDHSDLDYYWALASVEDGYSDDILRSIDSAKNNKNQASTYSEADLNYLYALYYNYQKHEEEGSGEIICNYATKAYDGGRKDAKKIKKRWCN